MILPVKRHKNNRDLRMTSYLKELVAGYENTDSEIVKRVIYNDMLRFEKEADPHVVCYDMDLYVMLYKYATTSFQRKYALDHISGIIDDDYLGEDGILFNFEDFIPMKDFLHKDDVERFDCLCKAVLDYFLDLVEEALRPKQHHVVPLDSIGVLKGHLRKVAEAVKSTEMKELESYKLACNILA